MKQLLILLILVTSPLCSFSQAGFRYDDAGNRERRFEIVTTSKSADEIENADIQEFEIDKNFSLLLYPNPTSGLLNFSVQAYDNDLKIELKIYSINGRLVQAKSYAVDHFTIDITNESNGVYLLDILLNNKPQHFTIIKE